MFLFERGDSVSLYDFVRPLIMRLLSKSRPGAPRPHPLPDIFVALRGE